jgi:hypothetical protein
MTRLCVRAEVMLVLLFMAAVGLAQEPVVCTGCIRFSDGTPYAVHEGTVPMTLPWVVLTGAGPGAQEAVSPLPGTRLRVTAPTVTPKPIVGTLLETTEREVARPCRSCCSQSKSTGPRQPSASLRRIVYWKYPFTSSTKCTAPTDPFFTFMAPVPSVARGTTALFARVTPVVKLTLLTSGALTASPG